MNELGNTTRIFYDKNDRVIKEVLPEQYKEELDDGAGTTYQYNLKGQVVEVRNPLGEIITKNEYDYKGNIISSIDGISNKVEYTYNLLGQIKDIITPNSKKDNKAIQSYIYDIRGNITGICDGNGNSTIYKLDDWGRIEEIINPEGGVEKYTYDYAGNITSTTDPNGNTITYLYNRFNKVCEIKDQEGDSEYFYYDTEGNQVKHIDRNENKVFYGYNIDSNITFRKGHDKNGEYGLYESFKYNEDGTLKLAKANHTAYSYTYTKDRRLKSKQVSGKTFLNYEYDKNNNIKSIKDITGKSTKYMYDPANRVKEILNDQNRRLATYIYDPNNNIKDIHYGNGITTNYTYDKDQNIASLITKTSKGEILVDYYYDYDFNGNSLQKVGSKHQTYYKYDSLNRLTNAKYDKREESFTYDLVGNRLTKTTNTGIEKYTYNVKNQLISLATSQGITNFYYDKQGNTIEEKTSQGNNSYEYNVFNQQIKAITKEGNTLVSRYDAHGLRTEIEENEKLTKFIFHKENILIELDEEENLVSRFARGHEVVASEMKDKAYYYQQDEQGSTIYITDQEENVQNEYHYDAFGAILKKEEKISNRITYTGQQYDNATQQYYLRARYYNPNIGRFTQEDTYRGDGLNLYTYCRNNPVIYYDPSGFASVNKEKAFANEGNGKTEDIKDKKNGVLGIGLSGSAHLMGGGTAGKTMYFDRNGNIAIMNSTSLTATTDVELSAGVNVEVSLTANDVRQMEGRSVVSGVGGDVPGISPGGNYEYSMCEGTGEITSHSLGLNMNLGVSPAEVHGGMSGNEMITRFNYKNLEGEHHGSIFGKKYSIKFDFKNWEFEIN